MTTVSNSLLVAVLLPLAVVAQQPTSGIEVHWRSFHQRACAGATELHLAALQVQGTIVFSNRGKSEVLLWRGPHSRGEIRLKPSAPLAGQGRTDVVFYPPLVVPSSDSPAVTASDGDFVLLAPGQSFEETFQFGFPFPITGNPDRSVEPQDGSYEAFVQISLTHGTAVRRDKAVASGLVWTDGIPIVIDGSAPLERCSPVSK